MRAETAQTGVDRLRQQLSSERNRAEQLGRRAISSADHGELL